MEKDVVGTDAGKGNRYFSVGKYYHKLQDFDKAVENYTKGIEKEPANAEIYFNRGLARIAKRDYDKAIADINKAIDSGGDFPEAHHALGNIYDQQQNFSKARDEYNKAIQLSQKTGARPEPAESPAQKEAEGKKFAFLEKPDLNFLKVAGLASVKEMINESIVYPLKDPKLAERYGKKAGGGVIFYGPPGCGKTFIGKATAGECSASFLSIKISDIMDMYVGNTEKNIHGIFDMARKHTPSIIFFDEIDGLGGRRDSMQQSFEKRAINQLLIEMDGVEYSNEGVLIIGSTNAPWFIDPALRRSGRFSRFIYFPEPDKMTRQEVFTLIMKDKPMDKGISFSRLARLTEGYSIADITAVCNEALAIPWKEALKTGQERKIQFKDFVFAMAKVRSSLPAWYDSVRKFLVKEEKTVRDRVPSQGRTIIVEHKRAQEELITDEERKLFSELVRCVSAQGSFQNTVMRKIRVGVARYIN